MVLPNAPIRLAAAALLCLLLVVPPALAQSGLSASATVSRERMAVGEAVEFTIQVNGGSNIQPPREIPVDGLDVQYRGYSSQMRNVNGRTSWSAILTYTVEAQRAGSFTIPAVELTVEGETLRTQPVGLKVEQGQAQSGTAPAGGESKDGAMHFAQIVVPKNTAYLGETIPVELRLHVDARVRWQPEQMPSIDGDGFTKTKIPNPRQERARKDGKDYDVLVFRTAITPSKAGKITIGPSEVVFNAQVPRARRNRGRSLFEDFFDNDIFSDPFFAQTQQVKSKAAAVEIEVKPIPTAGRPKSFSGAVGQFKMVAEGTPSRVKIGDPVTLKMNITGKGSFDRVNAPVLLDPQGWHTYPATGQFSADDELGVSGTKAFEMPVIPEVKKTAMPRVEFSYFDPAAEKFVVLTNEEAPLIVEGSPAPATPPPSRAIANAPAASAAPAPETPTARPEAADIVGLRYDAGTPGRSFDPLYKQPAFLAAQAVPAAALLAFAAWRLRRKDEAALATARLRQEKAALWKTLRNAASADAFFDAAVRFVQAQTALATGQPRASVDFTAARAATNGDSETAAVLEEIFRAHGERVYAGAGGGGDTLSSVDRARLIAGIQRFEKAHA